MIHRPKVVAKAIMLTVAALMITACGSDDGSENANEGRLIVVATTTIVGDVASNVAGEDADVTVLMPIGADPHDFQASASQVATINGADLVVANGLFLEEGLEDVMSAAVTDGVRVIELAPLLDPIPFAGDVDHGNEEDADHGHEEDSYDPHVWFDPERMGEAARLIAAELAVVDPGTDWMARAETYAAELDEADEEIEGTLAGIEEAERRLVTNHNALGYFAARYNFELIGTVIPAGSTLADPSSEELAELIEIMTVEGVNVIFAETTQPTALAEAVAAELGEAVDVVSLYTGSLDEPGSGADTLIGMLRTNANRIAAALDG